MFLRTLRLSCFPLIAFLLCSCGSGVRSQAGAEGAEKMGIRIESPAFEEGEMIPKKYTGDGEDISPPLSWSAVPEGTNSIALICDDPDAPAGTWVHWVIFNIPAGAEELPEGVPTDETLENGARQGKNGWKKLGYRGPAPPRGTHRYYFKIYALDLELDLKPGATKEELLEAMEGRILDRGRLMGKYRR